MNIDERLEMLVHVAASHEDSLKELFELQTKNETMQAKTELMLAQVVESIGRLERIAFMPERRLTDLEGGAT